MTVYTIANLVTGFVESVMMFTLCEAFCRRKTKIPAWAYVAGIIIVAIAVDASNAIFKYGIANGAVMIFAFFAMSFLYDVNPLVGMLIAVFNNALVMIFEMVTLYTIIIICHVSVTEVADIPAYNLLGIIMSKMLSLLATNMLRLKYQNKYVHKSVSYWLMFFLTFTTSAATVLLIFELTYKSEKAEMYNFSTICSYGLLFTAFFVFYLYEHLSKQEEIIRIHQQYEQQMKMQMSHYDEVLISQRQLKEFKHDFKNCMIGVRAYMNKNDAADVGKYSGELNDRFSKADRNLVETGNPALDAVLSTKKAIAQSKNIEFNTKLQIPENLPANAIDICIIFGNALDNAIEACVRTNRTDAKIDVAIVYRANALYCKIVNTAPPPEKKKIKTSKSDKANHGYGLENIRTALAKYETEPKIEHTGDKFTFEFMIIMPD